MHSLQDSVALYDSGIRSLDAQEIDAISGGVTASQIFAVGAGASRLLALVPGPQQPFVGAASGVLALAAAGAALLDI
jgi:hypothetical protein